MIGRVLWFFLKLGHLDFHGQGGQAGMAGLGEGECVCMYVSVSDHTCAHECETVCMSPDPRLGAYPRGMGKALRGARMT